MPAAGECRLWGALTPGGQSAPATPRLPPFPLPFLPPFLSLSLVVCSHSFCALLFLSCPLFIPLSASLEFPSCCFCSSFLLCSCPSLLSSLSCCFHPFLFRWLIIHSHSLTPSQPLTSTYPSSPKPALRRLGCHHACLCRPRLRPRCPAPPLPLLHNPPSPPLSPPFRTPDKSVIQSILACPAPGML